MRRSRVSLFAILLMLIAMMLFVVACSSPSGSNEETGQVQATEAPADSEESGGGETAVTEPEAAEPEEISAPTGGEFQLQWWGSQNRHERTIATIEKFLEEHPDYDITYEFVGWGDYWTSLATKAAGGNLPDVIQQDYARFYQFAEDGLIVPLDPYIEAGLIDLSNVPDDAIAGGRIGGDLYALSLGTNSQSFVLDLDVFEEAGLDVPPPDWTWADFEEIAMAIHESTGKYGVVGGLANPQIVNALFLSLGQGLYSEDGLSLGFTDPQPLIDYFSMMVRLQDAGAMVSREEEIANPTNLENNAFVTGNAGMFFAHTNQYVALNTAAGEGRNLMMVPVPRAEGATQSANYLKPSMFFSLTSHGENLEAGAVFIDYFTNSVEANEILAAERGVPVSTAVAEAIKPNMEPAAAATFDFLANLEVSPIQPPDPIAHGDIQTNLYEPLVIDPLMYGQITPEEATALFMEEANKILAGQEVSLSTEAPAETAAEVPLAEGEFQLQWWGSQNRHERTIATVEQFMEENPDVEVTYEFVGWGDYWTSLATKAAGGNLPDVIQQDYARFFQFQQDGLLVPLDSYVEAGLIDLSNVPEDAIAGGMIDGELYALSLGTNSQSFVLDLDVFEEAGVDLPAPDWTWADFEEIAMAIHENTGKYGVVADLSNPQIVNSLYLSLGEGLYNEDGTALGFSDKQPLVDYYSMMVRLQEAGAMPSREEEIANPTNLENNQFVSGDGGMFFAHTNQFVALYTAAGADRNLMMVPLPRAVNAIQSANYLKPSMFFSLTSHGENLDAGALFINFFTNSVEANEILAAERGVPVSTAVAEAIKPNMEPAAAATFDFLANLEVSPIQPPDPVAHGDIQTNVYGPLVIDPMMFGQITPEEAVDLFIEEANSILADQ